MIHQFHEIFFLMFGGFLMFGPNCGSHRRKHGGCHAARRPFRRSGEEDQGRRQPAGLPKFGKRQENVIMIYKFSKNDTLHFRQNETEAFQKFSIHKYQNYKIHLRFYRT